MAYAPAHKIVAEYIQLSFKALVPNDLLHWILLFYDETAIFKEICRCDDATSQFQYLQLIRVAIQRYFQSTVKSIIDHGIYYILVYFCSHQPYETYTCTLT